MVNVILFSDRPTAFNNTNIGRSLTESIGHGEGVGAKHLLEGWVNTGDQTRNIWGGNFSAEKKYVSIELLNCRRGRKRGRERGRSRGGREVRERG